MNKLTLGAKIGLGFGVIITISLILGGTGYRSAVKNGEAIYKVGTIEMQGVFALKSLQQDAQRIKVIQRNLLNPALDEETRLRQYTNLAKVEKDYEAAFNTYEALPKSQEEAVGFKELQAAWTQWCKDSGEFLQLGKQLNDMQVGDPNQLREDIEIFCGDHYHLEVMVFQMINTKQVFEGHEDATKCNFGKWKAGLTLQSPELRGMVQQCETIHQQVHDSTKKIKELVRSNDLNAAMAVFQTEMVPAADATLKELGAMAALAGKAQKQLDKMAS